MKDQFNKTFPLAVLTTKTIIAQNGPKKFVMPKALLDLNKKAEAATADDYQTDTTAPGLSTEDKINQLLIDAPYMSPATFMNLMKSQGIKFTEAYKVKEGGPGSGPQAKINSAQKAVNKAQNNHDDKQTAKTAAGLKKANAKLLQAHQDNINSIKAEIAATKAAYSAKFGDKESAFPIMKMGQKKLEADSSGSFPAVLRSKESAIGRMGFKAFSRFLESAAIDNGIGPTEFDVILIQEGLGNFGNAFYYTKSAIESGIMAFEGKKCFANHPTSVEEDIRPERDVKDIIGHFEHLRVDYDKSGRAELCGTLCIMPQKAYEWARAQAIQAVAYAKKFPDKDFIGLSINANGDAQRMPIDELIQRGVPQSAMPKIEEALQQGVTEVKIVNKISEATSCDLVTEAGAGGKFLSIIK